LGRPNGTHRKIERWAEHRSWVAAVFSIDTTTNQSLAAAGGGGVGDETQPRRNAWGGLFPVVWGGKWGDEKIERGTEPQL
jgi:hypothetical protein